MIAYLLAVLSALANAIASVLERRANREESKENNLSLRLIWNLLHRTVWLASIVAVTAGFGLQAAALSQGQLASVQPVLVIELPLTLVLAARTLRARLESREWASIVVMAAGLAVLEYFLAPGGGSGTKIPWTAWLWGLLANTALITGLVLVARRRRGHQRAALLGVASGSTFGMTAALMKGVVDEFARGFVPVFTSWQLYAMVAAGILAMFLLQSAMNAGRLLVVQPGTTLADPIVAILWGVFAFGEQVHGGVSVVAQVMAGVAMGISVVTLSRSPLLADEHEEGAGTEEPSSATTG